MARGVQLGQLITDVRAECGYSVDTETMVNSRSQMRHLINRIESTLYDDFAWPFAVTTVDETLFQGQRYYSFDATLDFERVEKVWWRDGGDWIPVEYGITPDLYNIHDSDVAEEASPVRRWQHYDTDQYEVWPIPDSNTAALKMRGRRKLVPMVDDADTSTLDGNLLVLFAAAHQLAADKREDAQVKMAEARQLYNRLRAQAGSSKRRPFILGGGADKAPIFRPGIDYISG